MRTIDDLDAYLKLAKPTDKNWTYAKEIRATMVRYLKNGSTKR